MAPEFEPLKVVGELARWVRAAVKEGAVLLLGYEGRQSLGGVEVIGSGQLPPIPTSDVVEEAFLELFTTLAEVPYRLDPRGIDLVEGHEWRGALAAYILSRRLRVPFRYSLYTRESERGGFGLVSESVRSIEEFLLREADETVERRSGRVEKRAVRHAAPPSLKVDVLHVSWEYPPHIIGGLGRAVTSIAKWLSREVKTCVLSIGMPGRVVDEAGPPTVLRVDPFLLRTTGLVSWVYAFNALMVLKALALRVKPHLIHAHDWLSAPAAVALKHLLKVPLIAAIHATEYGRSRGTMTTPMQLQINYWEWRLVYEAWRVFVCSEAMKWEARAAFSLPLDKVAVLPNGIDLEEFDEHAPQPEERGRYALPWERIVFFAGRHVHDKGVDALLEAARILLSRRADVKFVIASDGPMRMHLEWLKRSYGLGDKVFLTGRLPDDALYRAMKLADVVVMPSRYEPFGIVALEAMAAAKPVVATRVGGLAEVVVDGEVGVHVPPDDPFALADAIEYLVTHLEVAREMGARSRQRVEEHYRWDKVIRYMVQVYQRVVEECEVSGWSSSFDLIDSGER